MDPANFLKLLTTKTPQVTGWPLARFETVGSFSLKAKDSPKMRRHLQQKSPGNRVESRETSCLLMTRSMVGNTASTFARVSVFSKNLSVNGNTERTSSFYLLSWVLLRFFGARLLATPSVHVYRPRLPVPRLPTCHSNRGTPLSGILGSWVGAQ